MPAAPDLDQQSYGTGYLAALSHVRQKADALAARLADADEFYDAITPESLRKFAAVARRKLRNEDGTFARHYLRAVAQKVVVSDKSTAAVHGTRSELLRALPVGADAPDAAALLTVGAVNVVTGTTAVHVIDA